MADKDVHIIYNPQGPHSDYIGLYDLVLRPKSETSKTAVSKEGYRKSAKEYYEGLDEWSEAFEADYRELTKQLEGDTVLSLGCGSGRIEKRLSSIYKIEGVDNNETALKMCENKKLKAKNVDLEKGKLPYEDNSFDNVIGAYVLEHLDNVQDIIKEARRVAKRRVVFIVSLGERQDVTHKHIFKNRLDFRKQALSSLNIPDKKLKLKKVSNGDNNTIMLVLKAEQTAVTKAALKPFDIAKNPKDEGNIDYKVDDAGKAILQLHIMGIEEEKLDALKKVSKETVKARTNPTKLKALLKGAIGEQGCHIDLRMVRKGDDYFEGGEIMLGNLTGLDKLKKLDEDGKLRFGWKTPHIEEPTAETIRGPVSWMEAGKNGIEIFPPGEAGATSQKYGAMLILDEFAFEMTQADEHAKKFVFSGCKMIEDGTYLTAYVPVAEGERVWMISRLKAEEQKFEKYVPIFVQKADEQIVCGIVYEPNEEDVQGDTATAAEIQKAAYQFMEDVQVFKINHKGKHIKAKVLESYIAPQDLVIAGQKIKKGSWLLTTRILDKKIWEDIKSGELMGYSMAGYAMAG